MTFGCIRGGTSPNIIPDEVELLGTIRTFTDRAAAVVEERIVQVARGLSAASRTAIEVAFRRGTEAVVNDPEVTAVCVQAARQVVGAANVEEIRLPSMGGEDFSGYLKHVPGCLLRLGVAALDRPRHSLHSQHFDIDEAALAIGARLLAHSVVLLSSATGSRPREPVQVRHERAAQPGRRDRAQPGGRRDHGPAERDRRRPGRRCRPIARTRSSPSCSSATSRSTPASARTSARSGTTWRRRSTSSGRPPRVTT